MKKILFVLFLITAFGFHLFAKGDVSKSKWSPNVITIDGKDNDWIKPLNYYDDKSGVMFGIENDGTNLYLCFTNNDDLKMRKMINAGWKIELVSKEKKKKFKAEIEFPAVKMMGMRMRRDANKNENKISENNIISFYKSNITAVRINGFKSGKTEVSLEDRKDINVGIGTDSTQHVIYEISVPLRELYELKEIHLDEDMTLHLTVNAMERPGSGGGMSARGGYHSGGGMGGRPGGGRMAGGMSGTGGGRYGGMSHGGNGTSAMNGMFESVSFKQEFSLSSKQ
jgi:hypothetical protein